MSWFNTNPAADSVLNSAARPEPSSRSSAAKRTYGTRRRTFSMNSLSSIVAADFTAMGTVAESPEAPPANTQPPLGSPTPPQPTKPAPPRRGLVRALSLNSTVGSTSSIRSKRGGVRAVNAENGGQLSLPSPWSQQGVAGHREASSTGGDFRWPSPPPSKSSTGSTRAPLTEVAENMSTENLDWFDAWTRNSSCASREDASSTDGAVGEKRQGDGGAPMEGLVRARSRSRLDCPRNPAELALTSSSSSASLSQHSNPGSVSSNAQASFHDYEEGGGSNLSESHAMKQKPQLTIDSPGGDSRMRRPEGCRPSPRNQPLGEKGRPSRPPRSSPHRSNSGSGSVTLSRHSSDAAKPEASGSETEQDTVTEEDSDASAASEEEAALSVKRSHLLAVPRRPQRSYSETGASSQFQQARQLRNTRSQSERGSILSVGGAAEPPVAGGGRGKGPSKLDHLLSNTSAPSPGFLKSLNQLGIASPEKKRKPAGSASSSSPPADGGREVEESSTNKCLDMDHISPVVTADVGRKIAPAIVGSPPRAPPRDIGGPSLCAAPQAPTREPTKQPGRPSRVRRHNTFPFNNPQSTWQPVKCRLNSSPPVATHDESMACGALKTEGLLRNLGEATSSMYVRSSYSATMSGADGSGSGSGDDLSVNVSGSIPPHHGSCVSPVPTLNPWSRSNADTDAASIEECIDSFMPDASNSGVKGVGGGRRDSGGRRLSGGSRLMETPQAKAGWGSRPEFGDWGLTPNVPAEKLTLMVHRVHSEAGDSLQRSGSYGSPMDPIDEVATEEERTAVNMMSMPGTVAVSSTGPALIPIVPTTPFIAARYGRQQGGLLGRPTAASNAPVSTVTNVTNCILGTVGSSGGSSTSRGSQPLTPAERLERRRLQEVAKMRRVSVGLASRREGAGDGLADHMAMLGLSSAHPSVSTDSMRQAGASISPINVRGVAPPARTTAAAYGGTLREEEDEDSFEMDTVSPLGLQASTPLRMHGVLEYATRARLRVETPPHIREALEQSTSDISGLSMNDREEDDSSTSWHHHPMEESDSDDSQQHPVMQQQLLQQQPCAAQIQEGAAPAPMIFFLPYALLPAAVSWLPGDDQASAAAVCLSWASAAALALADVAGDLSCDRASVALEGSEIETRFPWGCFLSEGATKRVYRVWNAVLCREEAIGVMDVVQLSKDGQVAIVSRELRIGSLVSSLVRRGVCPNFVQTYGFFRSEVHAAKKIWEAESSTSSAKDKRRSNSPGPVLRNRDPICPPRPAMSSAVTGGRKPKRNTMPRYQYIGMELCDLADAEAFLMRQAERVLPVPQTVAVLFQMLFALFAGRHELSLRHYDVKLLNFMVQDLSAKSVDDCVTLQYGLGEHIFAVHMASAQAVMVKLADFGTSDVATGTYGQPIGVDHFATLENAPPELLYMGSNATQDFSKDTFSTGLAALHLFTGEAPYEELMESVRCPGELRFALDKVWSGAPEYDVVVISNKDSGEDVMFHTLYRYFVLLGLPGQPGYGEAFDRKTKSSSDGEVDENWWRNNPVWVTVAAYLVPELIPGQARRSRAAVAVTEQFMRDQAAFSLRFGQEACMVRARARLNSVPGMGDLVYSMLKFDPSRRPTMLELLLSPAFCALRSTRIDDGREGVQKYMAFYRGRGSRSSREALRNV